MASVISTGRPSPCPASGAVYRPGTLPQKSRLRSCGEKSLASMTAGSHWKCLSKSSVDRKKNIHQLHIRYIQVWLKFFHSQRSVGKFDIITRLSYRFIFYEGGFQAFGGRYPNCHSRVHQLPPFKKNIWWWVHQSISRTFSFKYGQFP